MNISRTNSPLSQGRCIAICMHVMSEIFDAMNERVRYLGYE